jgi:hypothetical protein
MVDAAYDLVLQTYIRSSLLANPEESKYRFRCVGASEEFGVKNRGFDIGDEMDADFGKVWAAQKVIVEELERRKLESETNSSNAA